MNADIITAVPLRSKDLRCFRPPADQEKRIRDALAYLVFKWQFFAQIIYDDMDILYTYDVPIAATDSYSIFVNPTGFSDHEIIEIVEIVFVLAHEVGHRVLNHLVLAAVWRASGQVHCPSGAVLPYDHRLMGMAKDYIVNAMLVTSKIGRMPKCGLYDPRISAQGMEPVAEIYEKLWKKRPPRGGGGGGGDGGGFDIHIEPEPTDIAKDKGKREQTIIAAAQLSERLTPGSLPAAIRQLIDEIVNPKVPWEQHLRSTMTRKAGEPKLDWRYLNRRLAGRQPPMYYAKRGHKGAGIIVVGYDSSGSCINPDTQTRFFGEMAGIAKDLNPRELVVVWCDAVVQRVDRLEEPTDLEGLRLQINELGGAPGGGGTDFRPVFDYIERENIIPDMLVYLTDMEGAFPQSEPYYPVIWASILRNKRQPFGELVDVEI